MSDAATATVGTSAPMEDILSSASTSTETKATANAPASDAPAAAGESKDDTAEATKEVTSPKKKSKKAAPKKKAGAKAKKDDADAEGAASEAEGDETAAAAKPKKERKPRSPKPTPPASPVSTTSSRGRVRKAVEAYVPEAAKEKDDFAQTTGTGKELGEIESIKEALDGIVATADEMKLLFRACYPDQKAGHTKTVIKKNIRAFDGYPKGREEELRELATTRLTNAAPAVVKAVGEILGVSTSGSKAKTAERIVDFLEKPSGSSGGKKRKHATVTKTGKRVNAYMLFSNEHRAEVAASMPGAPVTDVARKLGEMWRDLSDKEQQKYKDIAAGSKSGSNKSDAEESEEESEADGSDADEEEEEEEAASKPKQTKTKEPAKKKAKSESSSLSSEWEAKFRTSIEKILGEVVGKDLTMRVIKEKLAAEHGELVVEANSDAVKELALTMLKKQTAAQA